MTEAVIVAVLTGGFGLVGTMIAVLAKNNAREHQENGGKLDRIIEATENLKNGHTRIEGKIDGHIGDHARGDV
jgi:hypothetical protein